MSEEAASEKLGRLFGRARKSVTRTRRPAESSEVVEAESTIDLDLSDALARAEAAEAEVERLRAELAGKQEILAEARIALRTARLALRDHLRMTDG